MQQHQQQQQHPPAPEPESGTGTHGSTKHDRRPATAGGKSPLRGSGPAPKPVSHPRAWVPTKKLPPGEGERKYTPPPALPASLRESLEPTTPQGIARSLSRPSTASARIGGGGALNFGSGGEGAWLIPPGREGFQPHIHGPRVSHTPHVHVRALCFLLPLTLFHLPQGPVILDASPRRRSLQSKKPGWPPQGMVLAAAEAAFFVGGSALICIPCPRLLTVVSVGQRASSPSQARVVVGRLNSEDYTLPGMLASDRQAWVRRTE